METQRTSGQVQHINLLWLQQKSKTNKKGEKPPRVKENLYVNNVKKEGDDQYRERRCQLNQWTWHNDVSMAEERCINCTFLTKPHREASHKEELAFTTDWAGLRLERHCTSNGCQRKTAMNGESRQRQKTPSQKDKTDRAGSTCSYTNFKRKKCFKIS